MSRLVFILLPFVLTSCAASDMTQPDTSRADVDQGRFLRCSVVEVMQPDRLGNRLGSMYDYDLSGTLEPTGEAIEVTALPAQASVSETEMAITIGHLTYGLDDGDSIVRTDDASGSLEWTVRSDAEPGTFVIHVFPDTKVGFVWESLENGGIDPIAKIDCREGTFPPAFSTI